MNNNNKFSPRVQKVILKLYYISSDLKNLNKSKQDMMNISIENFDDYNSETKDIILFGKKIGFVIFKDGYFDYFFDFNINFSLDFILEDIKYQYKNNPYPDGPKSFTEIKFHAHSVCETQIRDFLTSDNLNI